MAIDTTAVTAVITALRTETRESSITPSRLGTLLQSIVDLFKKCTSATDVSLTAITAIRYSWTKSKTGLTLTLILTDSKGMTTNLNIPFPIVSDAQAGLMTSAQLEILNGGSSEGGSGGESGDDTPSGDTTTKTMYLGFLPYTTTEAADALAALPTAASKVAVNVTTTCAGTYSVTNDVAGNYLWIAVPESVSQPNTFLSSGLAFPFETGVKTGGYYLYRSSDRLKANTVPITLGT